MQHAIRLAVCMALASTSTAVWADDGFVGGNAALDPPAGEVTPGGEYEADDVGGGGREIAAGPEETSDPAAAAQRPDLEFLQTVWTSP